MDSSTDGIRQQHFDITEKVQHAVREYLRRNGLIGDLDDACQVVFLRLLKSTKYDPNRASPEAYARGFAKNVFEEIVRRRYKERLFAGADAALDPIDPGSIEDLKYTESSTDILAALLQRTTPKEQALLKHLLAGEPINEIAATLNISPNTCSKRKERLFEKLRKLRQRAEAL